MKLSTCATLLFLVTSVFASKANSQNVKVDISGGRITIENLMEQIENQTDYLFVYSKNEVNTDRRTTVSQGEQTVGDCLDEALSGVEMSYDFKDDYIVLKKETVQKIDKRKVEGQVVDNLGPIIGANVQVKGSDTGIITDDNGNFSINALDTDILLVSYIGYEIQEIPVAGRKVINIVLEEDIQALDELVVIGYGVVKKRDLTGSVTRIDDEILSDLPVASIDQALQGRAAGVQISSVSGQPGAATSIRIRGGNSVSADNEPIYVIDGFIGGGDLSSINPSDIESIEILKDASATAIYGSRGANGVIMITTKKGKEGGNRVNVSFYQGFQEISRELPFMHGKERAQYANDFADFTGGSRPFPNMDEVTHTDWQDLLTRVASVRNASVSFSGGNDTFKHYVSANYYDQEGVYKGSEFSRYQARVNLDKELFKWLRVGVNLNASSTHSENPKFDYMNFIQNASTTSPVYNEDGSYMDYNIIDGKPFENPMANLNLGMQDDTYKKRFLGTVYVDIMPIKNLIIRSTAGGDFASSLTEQYSPGTLPIREKSKIGGLARINNSNSFNFLNENTINYTFEKNKHSFGALLGMTVQTGQNAGSWTQVEGFPNDIMEFHNLSAGDHETAKYSSSYSANAMLSFLGRLNYSYDSKYLLTVTGRYDGSSRLAQNYKWGFFPSVAAAWVLSEEDFIKNTNIFHNLKLRASYGITGNQAINAYQSLASLSIVNPSFGGSKDIGYLLDNIANPDLKWETTQQVDIGLEASFLDGRIGLEMDYYYKRTKDLLMSVEIPWTAGFESQLQNVGEVENMGFEFMFNANIISTKDWSWDFNFNISFNRNKVLDLDGLEYIDLALGVRLYEGMPAGTFVGAVYDGPWKSQEEIDANPVFMPGARPGTAKFKDVNGNGKYDGVGDYDVLGSAEADFFGGFGTAVRWKGLALDLFFQGTYGNEIYNPYAAHIFFGMNGANLYTLDEKPWSESNPNSNLIAPGGYLYNLTANSISYDPNVQDGSYLKLKTLKLSYDFPTRNVKWLGKLNIYFLANNLFTWTNYTWGYDPDVTGTGAVVRGVDKMAYPQNRTYQLGFNIEF